MTEHERHKVSTCTWMGRAHLVWCECGWVCVGHNETHAAELGEGHLHSEAAKLESSDYPLFVLEDDPDTGKYIKGPGGFLPARWKFHDDDRHLDYLIHLMHRVFLWGYQFAQGDPSVVHDIKYRNRKE